MLRLPLLILCFDSARTPFALTERAWREARSRVVTIGEQFEFRDSVRVLRPRHYR